MKRLLLLALILWPVVAYPEIWYVSQNSGSDANAGNVSSAPKLTLNGAESHIGTNDTLYIGPGNYNESNNGRCVSDDYYKGGLYLNGVTGFFVTSWPDSARPRILGHPPSGGCIWPPDCVDADTGWDGEGFEFGHCSGFTVSNIDFRHCARALDIDYCSLFTIRSCTFDTIIGGPCFSGGTGFCDNTNGNCGYFHNFGAIFLGYTGSADGHAKTKSARITNCTFGPSMYSICGRGGPWSLSSVGINYGGIFSYEFSYSRMDSNTFSGPYSFIYMKGESDNNIYEYNHFLDKSSASAYGAIYTSSGKEDTIRYNVFENCDEGITWNAYGGSPSGVDTPLCYNNTFFMGGNDILFNDDGGVVVNAKYFNNITAKFTGKVLNQGGTTPNTIRFWDYNAYDNTAPSSRFKPNGTSYTFSTWQSSEHWDTAGSINASPDFFTDTTASGGRDFHLNSGGASYTTLSTGGRGSGWPTYMGALDPNVTITCPTVTQVSPSSGSTQAKYTVPLLANFYTDDAGDDIIVTLYGEKTDNTPDVLLLTDTIVQDSTNWTYNWGTLLEDSTYYWQLIATDTSCADTSPVWNFLVDSIPPVSSSAPLLIYGSKLQGVKLR